MTTKFVIPAMWSNFSDHSPVNMPSSPSTIDALKVFETIWVISNGGPGTSSEVLNVYLYAQAFAYNQVGTASAVVVVFFAIIVALSLVLLWARQKAKWN